MHHDCDLWPQRGRKGPPQEFSTPEESRALCLETEECALWHWVESTRVCSLKSRLVEKALGIILEEPFPNFDPEYCSDLAVSRCQLDGCFSCDGTRWCVWLLGDALNGFKRCRDDYCAPFADEMTTSTSTKITSGATATVTVHSDHSERNAHRIVYNLFDPATHHAYIRDSSHCEFGR
eukprot:Gregarina_sp_Pseudo_9__737@NODE_1471_length_1573_cov_30_629074_g1365_i0_p1_GENE_NODE_1471_length_1573_cov_30_629074_g1365_i0NODE_1471_length_1573_cov_30_629074_g1365_i0_p1_ORF_typecomplete_len178_score7_87PAN_1/PF00024_26/0_0024PAN_4/PF14295_6/0_0025PAN_4/PF14295_6/1_3e04_NODE_1471_length_1573_cov_30_629074_g1365_i09111444